MKFPGAERNQQHGISVLALTEPRIHPKMTRSKLSPLPSDLRVSTYS